MSRDMLDILRKYCNSDYVPMHMPGAKRNTELFRMDNPYGLDITEIDGFDNMHNPDGIIKHSFDRCSRVFGLSEADSTLFLVNGSSAGIMAAICGATDKKDKVIVARNSHISVYNSLYLNELNPLYVYPRVNEYGYAERIEAEDIERILISNDDVSAVIVTSPTYEGVVSDVKAIADIVHRFNAVLIVDEAHGAHFNFNERFPDSAVKLGADAVIQSIHKTLPAFTQTALLHICGDRINRERVNMYWNMFQTTSPSYILMSGIDRCVTILEHDGRRLFEEYIKRLERLRYGLEGLENCKLIKTDDISKLVIGCTNRGKWLYDRLLEDYHIQLEMASHDYVIAMTSIGDTDEYYERFLMAVRDIDKELSHTQQTIEPMCVSQNSKPMCVSQTSRLKCASSGDMVKKSVCSIYEAVNSHKENVLLSCAAGRTAGKKICIYPPGIPLVNEGEVIESGDVAVIERALADGLEVIGLMDNIEGVGVVCLR